MSSPPSVILPNVNRPLTCGATLIDGFATFVVPHLFSAGSASRYFTRSALHLPTSSSLFVAV